MLSKQKPQLRSIKRSLQVAYDKISQEMENVLVLQKSTEKRP